MKTRQKWLLLMLPHDNFLMPYGIMYISSALKKHGESVYTKNLTYNCDDIYAYLKRVLAEKKIDIVAFGGFSWQCSAMRRLADNIKNIDDKITIVIGGG